MDIFQQVKEFTEKTSLEKLPSEPRAMTEDGIRFISRMVISELMELASTVSDKPIDLVKECCQTDFPKKYKGNTDPQIARVQQIAAQADALIDMIYYICNVASRNGIDLGPVFQEVQKANMAKVHPDGTVKRREDGKILKPDGWKEPDIESVIRKQMQGKV